MAVKHTSAMRPRIFALPAPSPSPRRQPQPHELSGSASSPLHGPSSPSYWSAPLSSHVAPTSSVSHLLTPFLIPGLFVPPRRHLRAFGSRIPPSHKGLKCTSPVHMESLKRHPPPLTVLPLAPLMGPPRPPIGPHTLYHTWLPPPWHLIGLDPFSVQVASPLLLASLQAWFPNNLVPRNSNLPPQYMWNGISRIPRD